MSSLPIHRSSPPRQGNFSGCLGGGVEVAYGAERRAVKPFSFNLTYLYVYSYKGQVGVGDNNFSKAGNESQMAPLFWLHVPASQLLKPSVGKRKT